MKKKLPQHKRWRKPKFKNAEEEALFWEKHSILDYVHPDEFKIVKPKGKQHLHVSMIEAKDALLQPKKVLFTMRLEENLLKNVKKLALQKGIKYQSLLRDWIKDKYSKEHNK